ncbi:MAG: deoxyguanosinetriphosphate triphosphohydrolase [Gemmataceae bacterium]
MNPTEPFTFRALDGFQRENLLLAPYAMRSTASQGRRHPEPPGDAYRPIFQRDRERVVHSRAFRRLTSKTQVLVAQTNDHHRTRLTHSLEVAQVSRSVARMLGLNEDLTEAVALSHDLGHPPFGHAGERALNDCCSKCGGFDHNLHALRIVDELEHPYPGFRGLNLSWEVRSAFAYHSKCRSDPLAKELTISGEPLLEFLVVDHCDSLAYDTHDLDDALGAEIVTLDELSGLEAWKAGVAHAEKRWPGLAPAQQRAPAIRALFEIQVLDLVAETRRRLGQITIRSIEDVRATPDLVGFGPDVSRMKSELEQFLRQKVYRHPWVAQMAQEGQRVVSDLFSHFLENPGDLPAHFAGELANAEPGRVVCDYLAGMTDRFARQEHRRLCLRDESE